MNAEIASSHFYQLSLTISVMSKPISLSPTICSCFFGHPNRVLHSKTSIFTCFKIDIFGVVGDKHLLDRSSDG